LRGVILCHLDAFDDVLVGPFMPNGTVVEIDVGILLSQGFVSSPAKVSVGPMAKKA